MMGPITVDQVRRFLTGASATPRTPLTHLADFAEPHNSPRDHRCGCGQGRHRRDADRRFNRGGQLRHSRAAGLGPGGVAPVDGYEIPLRRARPSSFAIRRMSTPYGTCTSHRMDLDHTIPYQPLKSGRPARPDQPAQSRPARPHAITATNPWPWQFATARSRDLPVPIAGRMDIPHDQRGHGSASAIPTMPTRSGLVLRRGRLPPSRVATVVGPCRSVRPAVRGRLSLGQAADRD